MSIRGHQCHTVGDHAGLVMQRGRAEAQLSRELRKLDETRSIARPIGVGPAVLGRRLGYYAHRPARVEVVVSRLTPQRLTENAHATRLARAPQPTPHRTAHAARQHGGGRRRRARPRPRPRPTRQAPVRTPAPRGPVSTARVERSSDLFLVRYSCAMTAHRRSQLKSGLPSRGVVYPIYQIPRPLSVGTPRANNDSESKAPSDSCIR